MMLRAARVKLSRRAVIALAGAAGATALAACAAPTPTATPQPAPKPAEPTVEAPKPSAAARPTDPPKPADKPVTAGGGAKILLRLNGLNPPGVEFANKWIADYNRQNNVAVEIDYTD